MTFAAVMQRKKDFETLPHWCCINGQFLSPNRAERALRRKSRHKRQIMHRQRVTLRGTVLLKRAVTNPTAKLLGYWPGREYRETGFCHAVSFSETADRNRGRAPFLVQWVFAKTPSGHATRRFKSRVCAEAFAIACDEAIAAGGRPEDVPSKVFRTFPPTLRKRFRDNEDELCKRFPTAARHLMFRQVVSGEAGRPDWNVDFDADEVARKTTHMINIGLFAVEP